MHPGTEGDRDPLQTQQLVHCASGGSHHERGFQGFVFGPRIWGERHPKDLQEQSAFGPHAGQSGHLPDPSGFELPAQCEYCSQGPQASEHPHQQRLLYKNMRFLPVEEHYRAKVIKLRLRSVAA